MNEGAAIFNTSTLEDSTQFKVGGKGRLIINNNSDPLVGKTLEHLLTTQSAASAASGNTLETLLSKVTDLAENKQTDGESGRNKTILYLVLAALAGVAVIFGRRTGLWIVGIGAVAWFIFGKKAEAKT